MTLVALTLLLAAGPSRVEICGPLIAQKPKLRILPRTAPVFADFGQSPAAFEEPRARPRSYAELAGSPALAHEGPPERAITFRRYERKPVSAPRHHHKRRGGPPRLF